MTPDVMLILVDHLAITVGYVGLGIFLSSKFDAAGRTWELKVFGLACGAFFVCCAFDHADWALHIWSGQPVEMLSPPHLVVDTVQAVSALTALWFGFGFVSLRIFDRTYYAGLLDAAIDAEAKRVAQVTEGIRIGRLTSTVADIRNSVSRIENHEVPPHEDNAPGRLRE